MDNNDIENIHQSDINFDLQLREKSINEVRARMFAFEYSKNNEKAHGYKPFGVTPYQINQDNWKSYKILMVNKRSKNIILLVCFPADKKENFAIVQNILHNKSCDSQLNIIINIINAINIR